MKKRIFALLVMLMAVVFAVSVGAIDDGKLETAEDIMELMNSTSATVLGGTYELTADIDLTGVTGQSPIGSESAPFTGKFDGKGHVISGVNLVGTTGYWGFFGRVQGAEIKNLTLYGHIESDKYFVGGIVGVADMKSTLIENCVNHCTVYQHTNTATAVAGGIVGVIRSHGSSNVEVTVKNCVNYGSVTAHKQAAGIVGRILDKQDDTSTANCKYTITGCSNYGTVTCAEKNDTAAGIVGTVVYVYNSETVIENCYNEGDITGGYQVGGILGVSFTYTTSTKVTVDSCVNMGDIKSTRNSTTYDADAGGIVGTVGTGTGNVKGLTTIKNSFNGGNVSTVDDAVANVGQIFGSVYTASTANYTTGNCYSAVATVPTGGNATGGTPIAKADLGKASSYPESFEGVFLFTENGPYSATSHDHLISLNGDNCVCSLCGIELLEVDADGYIELSKAADVLLLMANSKAGNEDALGYNYILTTDINLANNPAQSPIGTKATPFTGIFDGNGKTVRGIAISGMNDALGFFGLVQGATIKNLTADGTITATTMNTTVGNGVGMIGSVGLAASTTRIENCVNYCTVSVTGGSNGRAGGIVGVLSRNKLSNIYLTIENCVNYGTITAPKHTGGILGRIEDGGDAAESGDTPETQIIGCVNFGTVQKRDDVDNASADGFGGIIGTVLLYSDLTVTECIHSGYACSGFRVGGILGSALTYTETASVTFDTCVNTGKVEAKRTDGSVSGILALAGTADAPMKGTAIIQNCFHSGTLVNNTLAGAGVFLGSVTPAGTVTCTSNYYSSALTLDAAIDTNGGESILAARWCILYGLASDADDLLNSTHFWDEEDVCLVCGVAKCATHTEGAYEITPSTCIENGAGEKCCVVCYMYTEVDADGNPVIVALDLSDSHRMGWDLTDDTARYGCLDCKDAALDADLTNVEAIYVSDNGDDANDGLTADKPVKSYELAQEIAAKFDKECTIYLVGTVTLAVSENNSEAIALTTTPYFEEAKHAKLITVTSADADDPATLVIPVSVSNYFLYGPVTFENLQIKGSVAGTTASDSSNIRIYARGFALTMGEGIETLNVSGNAIKVNKTTAGQALGLGTSVEIPNSKVSVYGGFLWNGNYDTDATNTDTFNTFSAELTVLSGAYWAIVGGDYSTSTASARTVDGATVDMTIGAVTARYVSAFNLNTDGTINNTTANVHYTDKFNIYALFRTVYGNGDGAAKGSGNEVNHFFYADVAGSTINNYYAGSPSFTSVVNCYYATEIEDDALIAAFDDVSETLIADGYQQPSEYLDFPVWCYKYGEGTAADDGHTFESNVCTFCGITRCDGTNHRYYHERGGDCILGCDAVKDLGSKIYVSDAGDDSKSGKSASNAIKSYALALEIAAAANKDFTIHLVGDVTLDTHRYSSANSVTGFEEVPHEYTITVTSTRSGGVNQGTLVIPNGVNYYFLYGPTTFKNINIKGSVAGTEDGGGYIRIFARGFDLTMSTGIEILNVSGSEIKVSKTDSGIDGFGATVLIPNSKVSVFGGFLWNGGYDAGDDNFNTFTSNITVLSGSYWAIVGGNYNTSSAAAREINGATANVTVDKVTARYISPLVLNSAAIINNTTANLRFTDDVNAAQTYRFAFGTSTTGSGNTVNYFFDKETAGSKIGDFGMGSYVAEVQVNMYYANALAADPIVLGYITKDEKYLDIDTATSSSTAIAYAQTSEIMNYSAYCVKYRGGHTLVDGVCSFCEITPCTTHSYVWEVVTAPTCIADGEEVYSCEVCAEIADTRAIAAMPSAHNAYWTYGESDAIYICVICQDVLDTKTYAEYTLVDNAIHVSASGSANGAGTAADPVNDFGLAMQIAAAQSPDVDVTVYIHDMATIYKNGPATDLIDYIEPAHANKITITSYGDTRAILRFEDVFYRVMTYNLSGPTEFTNIELSAWRNTKSMWIAARHNPLTMGEGISVDYQRRGSSSHASYVYVLGGCYYTKNSTACTGASGSDVTIYSGNYANIYGGTYNGNCCRTGDIHLKLLGDITTRGAIIAGNNGDNTHDGDSGNVYITVNGHLSIGTYFAFSSVGNNTSDAENPVAYTSDNVTLTILGGSINTENFSRYTSIMPMRVLGASAAGELTTSRIGQMLTVIVDKSSSTASALLEHLVSALTSDPSQNIVDGSSGSVAEEDGEVDEDEEGEEDGEDDPAGDDENIGATTDRTTNEGFYRIRFIGTSYCAANPVDMLHAHAPEEVPTYKIPVSCLSEGLATYTCIHCGDPYDESVPATGHDLGGVTPVTLDATCIAPAMHKYACNTCHLSVYEIVEGSEPLPGNVYASHVPSGSGFCELCNMDITSICPVDHEDLSRDNLDLGCSSGTKKTCAQCGWIEIDVTAEGVHNFGKYTVTREPTATEAGVKTRVCKSCGKTETALINASGDAINAGALATDVDGNLVGFDIEASKLSKVEKAALNALLQQSAYGSEVKVSYETDGKVVTGITYSIPVPAEYTEYENVMVVVKDDAGNLHFVDFQIEKGYIVFTF